MRDRSDTNPSSQTSQLEHANISRRALLATTTTLAGAAGLASLPEAAKAAKRPAESYRSSGVIIALGSTGLAETAAGKVRGYVRNGIYTYKGIPYAQSTAGKGRFMPPMKPEPWTGVRSSMYYGQVCPQAPRGGWPVDENAFMFEWDDGQPGEDCLRVNVWTPGLNDNRKRAVMVWIHGGGYSAGSGQELKAYDGENLARHGNVVVVSMNHRLNALGYLNLSEYSEQWGSASNVGMLDLVASLEWVRDNISNFGGDPGNVMIFGQSGGGGKVGVLMAMPAAKGLFHRAAIQSGSSLRQLSPEASAKLANATVAELGLSKSQIDQMQTMPYDRLVAAGVEAQKKTNPAAIVPGSGTGINWGPTVDGRILPANSFDPRAPEISAAVPLLVGTVKNEFTNGIGHPEYENMTMDEVKKRVKQRFGDAGDHIIEAYRSAHPDAKPFDTLSLILAAPTRQNAIAQAERKAALNAAPAYLYWFTWQTPILDGRPRAFHCCELPFCFDNADRCAAMTGGTEEARQLASKVSQAWIKFAQTGDPNHQDLPKWPAFSAGKVPTMVFDNTCEMKDDPDGPARRTVPGPSDTRTTDLRTTAAARL